MQFLTAVTTTKASRNGSTAVVSPLLAGVRHNRLRTALRFLAQHGVCRLDRLANLRGSTCPTRLNAGALFVEEFIQLLQLGPELGLEAPLATAAMPSIIKNTSKQNLLTVADKTNLVETPAHSALVLYLLNEGHYLGV